MTNTFGKRGIKSVAPVAVKRTEHKVAPTPLADIEAAHNWAVLRGYFVGLLPTIGMGAAGLLGVMVLIAGLSPSAEQEFINNAKDRIRSMMRDPDSTKFANLEMRDGYLKGCVKGRNGFGGYGDWQSFTVTEYGSIDIDAAGSLYNRCN
jgi:hypothetical protein